MHRQGSTTTRRRLPHRQGSTTTRRPSAARRSTTTRQSTRRARTPSPKFFWEPNSNTILHIHIPTAISNQCRHQIIELSIVCGSRCRLLVSHFHRNEVSRFNSLIVTFHLLPLFIATWLILEYSLGNLKKFLDYVRTMHLKLQP